MRIFPDSRAWVVLGVALSPVMAVWTAVWLRRPETATLAVPAIGILLVAASVSLIARSVRVDDTGITQGWRPFATRIAYADIDRIHHVFVSSRYGSSPCLAVTARGRRKEIRLPMKSFSVQKRRQLVTLLMDRAPTVRVDHAVAATLT